MNSRSSLRSQTILHYNAVGIVMNLLLSVSKLIVGLMIHSRAVILDALNGFSDMLSSLISLFSTLFAQRRTDRAHPFGYGRLEYITSMFSAAMIVFMGINAIFGATGELLRGDGSAPEYNTPVVVLMVVSLGAKLLYGVLSRRTGKKLRASALVMTGTESIGDALVSAAILATIGIYRVTGVDLEPWLSILLSLFIVKTGVSVILECADRLLGIREAPAVYTGVKQRLAEEPEVLNVFNLILHQYGEEQLVGSVEIEVDQGMTVAEATRLMRRLRSKAAQGGVRLSSIGIHGTDIGDPESAALWDGILDLARRQKEIVRAYAFSRDAAEKTAYFTVALDPSARDQEGAVSELRKTLESAWPDLRFEIETALDV